MQRNKGASGERELCSLIRDELGVSLVRNLAQSRQGGYDLVPADNEAGAVADALRALAIEVKRHAVVAAGDLRGWWTQAAGQAAAASLVPCLAYRGDRRDWRFLLPLSAINPGLTRADGFDFTADLSLSAFCAVMREFPNT